MPLPAFLMKRMNWLNPVSEATAYPEAYENPLFPRIVDDLDQVPLLALEDHRQ